jgi:hypothetical protein
MEEGKLLFTVDLDKDEPVDEVHLFNKRDLHTSKLGKLEIWINPNEGPKAHFHLKNANFESCIEIYKACYLHHKSIQRNGKLSGSQLEDLDDYLRVSLPDPDDETKPITRWEIVRRTWHTFNPQQETYYPIEFARQKKIKSQPNYRLMSTTEEDKE